ncbi:MAG: heme ABC transporter permease [Gammaproteobacteria bacterium]|nr:heme ABC transporter permease [Gammaproteobacteria bacterium]
MWQAITRLFYLLASPKFFYDFSGKLIPWLGFATIVLLTWGIGQGLFIAPPDYQQGESVRIIYIHVPAAWISMFAYALMALAAGISLIWRIKLADVIATSCAPIGAVFTVIALVTGSLWGKPTWGTYWMWDARLTSELILLFIYLGVIALRNAIEDPRNSSSAACVLSVVGVVILPIIHYSVEWWNTLHQPASIMKFGKPSVDVSMLIPLLISAIGFQFYFFTSLLMRARTVLLQREQASQWAQDVIHGTQSTQSNGPR